jgi:hypothetical protein
VAVAPPDGPNGLFVIPLGCAGVAPNVVVVGAGVTLLGAAPNENDAGDVAVAFSTGLLAVVPPNTGPLVEDPNGLLGAAAGALAVAPKENDGAVDDDGAELDVTGAAGAAEPPKAKGAVAAVDVLAGPAVGAAPNENEAAGAAALTSFLSCALAPPLGTVDVAPKLKPGAVGLLSAAAGLLVVDEPKKLGTLDALVVVAAGLSRVEREDAAAGAPKLKAAEGT